MERKPVKPRSKPATTRKKTATKKVAAKKVAAKKVAAKKKPATRRRAERIAIDLNSKDAIPQLMELAHEQDVARGERAEAMRQSPHHDYPRAPVRPSYPPHWNYNYNLHETLSPDERGSLTAFFTRFTDLGGHLPVQVVGPATPAEERRKIWDSNAAMFEAEQIRAHLPSDDVRERTARLEKALAKPGLDAWAEAVMLLSTWDEPTLPEAIARAEGLLASWPDAVRSDVKAWENRPELRALTRVLWVGKDASEVSPEMFARATVVHTQDTGWLEANQHRFAHIKQLVLSGKAGLANVVLRCTALENLEVLELNQPTYTSGTAAIDLAKLLKAPHLKKLRGLSLYGYTVNDKGLKALAACAQPLERLRIEYGKLQPDAGAHLATIAATKRLKGLQLKYNDLGPDGARALFARPDDWSALRVLDLSANEIGDRGVEAIVGAALTELRWLYLASNAPQEQLSANGARALASARTLARLETLNVHGHPVGAEGVAALVESPCLRALTGLNVGFSNGQLADIFNACGENEPVPLEALYLGSAQSDKRADWSRATFLRGVKTLSVDPLDGAQYEHFFECPHLEALECLVFGGCYSHADKGYKALLAAVPPPALRYLDLTGWRITAAQARALGRAPLFQQLWGLELMTSYTVPEAWYAFDEAGVPLTNSRFDKYPVSEYTSLTTLREEI